MRPMHNPPHPGLILPEDILPALGLTVTESAEQIGRDASTLSSVLNGRAGDGPAPGGWVSVDHGGRADVWIAQQAATIARTVLELKHALVDHAAVA